MDIKEELLKYQIHSKEQALRIAEYAVASRKSFQELMDCFLADHVKLAQRAAWSVTWATQKKPAYIQPYIGALVRQLKRTDVHNAVIRNSARILEDLEIPAEFHGEVMSICFDFIQNKAAPIAVKAFSLTVLFNLSKFYPEIKNELKIIIRENIDYESAAFQARGKKILAKI